MTTLCFVDTETTGLDPDQHQIWEVAIILRRPPLEPDALTEEILRQAAAPIETAASVLPVTIHARPADVEYVWQLPVDLGRADPMALTISGFHDRRDPKFGTQIDPRPVVYPTPVKHERKSALGLGDWCRDFARLTWGAHMVGCVPSFDTDRLWRLLRANGACPGWHYQPIDVETLAVGYLNGKADYDGGQWKSWHSPLDLRPPWGSEEISRFVGVDPDEFDRHSALGDARWARALWDAVQPSPWERPTSS